MSTDEPSSSRSGDLVFVEPEVDGPERGGFDASIVRALVALAAILFAADMLHSLVDLTYNQNGSGCRELTDASSRSLMWAMLPIRLLVVVWVVATALGLARRLSAAGVRDSSAARATALWVALPLSLVTMLYISSDVLSSFYAVVLQLLFITVGLIAATRRAVSWRARDGAGWLWLCDVWLIVAGIVLPVALLVITGDGAIRSC